MYVYSDTNKELPFGCLPRKKSTNDYLNFITSTMFFFNLINSPYYPTYLYIRFKKKILMQNVQKVLPI